MKLQQGLAALGLAAAALATTGPALAQSTASAFVGNLSYQLIDLAPDDGIDPYLTFTGSTTTFAHASLYSDTTFTNVSDDSESIGDTFSNADASNPNGTAASSASPDTVIANTSITGNSGWTLAQGTSDFILSPNTRVIFSVTTSVDAEPDFTEGGLGYAFAQALLYGEVANDSSNGTTSFSSSTFSLFLREDRTLVAVVDSQAFETAGWIGIQAQAESLSLAPPVSVVPEPASLGMLVAGLGLLSAVRRSRIPQA